MSTHSYATRWSARFGLASPAADQRPAAAQRGALPNSDGSEGSDHTAQPSRATANEFEKLKTSPHFATLLKLVEYAEQSIPALASDSDPEVVRSWIDLVGTTCEEKVGALALLRKLCASLLSGKHLQPLLRRVAQSQDIPADDFASLCLRTNVLEDEAAI